VSTQHKPVSVLQRLQDAAQGLWDGSSIRFGRKLSRLERAAHFGVLVGRSFVQNRCPARAAALSYTTLLALIPMLAVVLSVTSSVLKGESEEQIDRFIDRLVASLVPPANASNTPIFSLGSGYWPGEEEMILGDSRSAAAATAGAVPVTAAATNSRPVAGALASLANAPELRDARKTAAREIRRFIQNTRSGTLGVSGSVALVFLAILMLARIEDTFNDIWGVVRGRSWFLRVVLYWAVITLAPLLLISALALATGPHLEATRSLLTRMPFVGNLVFQFLPVLVLWLAFAGFYALMPNTRVEWTAALAGGLVCAVLWHLNNSFSALYVSRVVTNFKIYGGLGMVPVFMAGLYFSWLFLLLGAQVAYAWQNRSAYLQQKLAERIDQRGREFIALRLMTCVGQYFQSGQPAAPVSEMSASLGVPNRLSLQILRTLQAAGLVMEVAGREPAYLPARPLEQISCYDILLAMRATNGQQWPEDEEPATREVLGEFERIQSAERAAAEAVSVRALVERAQARLRLAAPTPDKTASLPVETAAPASLRLAGQVLGDGPADVRAAPPDEPHPATVPEATGADALQVNPAAQAVPPVALKQPTPDEERTFPL